MDINQILQQHNLTLIKSNIFNKDHIFLVADSSGKRMILKTDRINPAQIELFKIAKNMEPELCFKVPEIIFSGADYLLLEEIEGEQLNIHFNTYLNRYFEICKNISDDYQKIINEFKVKKFIKLKAGEDADLLQSGEKWLFESFSQWHKPIIESGLIEKEWFYKLEEKFRKSIKEKGEDFFGWAHGNIIGDHIVANEKGEYLLDLEILPRPGKNYYDFLRALDWIFLKSDKMGFDDIIGYIKKYLSNFDWKEARLVFAFRCIGILGCDIMKNRDRGAGDLEQKKADLKRFIRMDYRLLKK